MIRRQVKLSLESLFKEFGRVFEKPLPPPPSPIDQVGLQQDISNLDAVLTQQVWIRSTPPQIHSPNGLANSMDLLSKEDGDIVRRALETAIIAIIDLFQFVG